jgi:two-component system, LytTR family, sensor kinase
MLNARVAGAVALAWITIGVVLAGQAALGAAVQNRPQAPIATALPTALIQNVPWIPVTLIVIWLAGRFPVTRTTWRRNLPVHLMAAAACAWFANVLVVLGFWTMAGRFQGPLPLFRSAAVWATVNAHVAFLIYSAVLAATQIIAYYRTTKERELHLARVEGQLARAHIQALNAQIRPHFLFNTLHTIGQLWRSGKSDDADAVLDHLGGLFHKVQTSTARTEIPLGDELEIVREYLAIEQVRFRDRLRVTVNAAPDTLNCRVPPLILQPLVENAVRHGISAVSTAGKLDVSARVTNDTLHLEVRDDGPGNGNGATRPGSGTGLRNTRERLAQLYGDAGVLRIDHANGQGMRVTVELPVRTSDRSDD